MGGGGPQKAADDALFQEQKAQDQAHFDEQKANDAKAFAEQQDNNARFQAQQAADQARHDEEVAEEAKPKEPDALDKLETKVEAAVVDAAFLGTRGGVSSLGMMAGPLGGVGLIASLIGFGPEQPAQNGPTPPAQQNNNAFSFG